MAKHWWLGRISTDHTVAGNWSATDNGAPGITVPGTGDDVEWTGTGGAGGAGSDNPCDITANFACANFAAQATFTARLDLLTADVTIDSTKSIILDNSIFDMGSGTLSVTNGTFDNKDVGTFTKGNSTVSTTGTTSIVGDQSNEFFSITNVSGTLTIQQTDSNIFVVRDGVVSNSGEIVLAVSVLRLHGTANWRNETGGSENNGGVVQVTNGATGSGVSLNSGSFLSTLELAQFDADAVWVPGVYGDVELRPSNGAVIANVDDGTYQMTSIRYQTPGSGLTTTLNASTSTVYIVGDVTVDINAAGSVTINDGATTVWTITGDVINQKTGTGDFSWDFVSGATITASGGAAQNWELPALEPPAGGVTLIGDVIIAKDGGTTLTLGGDFECNSKTVTSGTFDTGGQDVTVTQGVDWQAGAVINDLSASTITCDTFDADGQTLTAVAEWFLTVASTAVATGTGDVQNSNASGGVQISAKGWADSGGNTDWLFAIGYPYPLLPTMTGGMLV